MTTVNWFIASEIQRLAPSAVIELFELRMNSALHGASTVLRFHSGTNDLGGDIVWAGQTYTRFPIDATGFDFSTSGPMARPRLRVSNILSVITASLQEVNVFTPGNDLTGAEVVRIRTLKKYLDAVNFPGGVNATANSAAKFPDDSYFIDRLVSEDSEAVEFELASPMDLNDVRLPRRQTIANICQWKYRGAECGYTGSTYFTIDDAYTTDVAKDACSKTLTGCKLRFGLPRDGWKTGTVAAGSTTLTLSGGTTDVRVGQYIQGFGVPDGTTVTAVGATTVTMSAASIATSNVSFTATSAVKESLITASGTPTGLAPGHRMISGNWYEIGPTSVTSISGTTVYLSEPPRRAWHVGDLTNTAFALTSGSAITDGDRVFHGSLQEQVTRFGAPLDVIWTSSTTAPGFHRFGNGQQVYATLVPYNKQENVSVRSMSTSPSAGTYSFGPPSSRYAFRTTFTPALPFGGFPGLQFLG